MDLTVIKKGETCLHVTLSRVKSVPANFPVGLGLMVSVKAHPALEEFCKNTIGDGKLIPVELINKGWVGTDPSKGLQCYNLPNRFTHVTGNIALDLGPIGTPLYQGDTVNLSFLRLAGISEGAGVSFYCKGVFSQDTMRNMKDKIGIATRALYNEYLRPVDMSIQVSTQEIAF